MSERKLATVTRITSIFPIEGADFIEAVTFTTNGWICVAKKGEFQAGDTAIFIEIDSFIPASDKRFEFLKESSEKTMNGKRGYRIKTVKRRKQISQGLALPLTDFPEFADCKIGDDVTTKLGITVYESQPARVGRFGFAIGRSAGKFPGFVKKTDEVRVQSMSNFELRQMSQHPFEITVKEDGTSCTMFYNKGKFGVCSRNLIVADPDIRDSWYLAAWKRIKKLFGYKSRPPRWFEISVYWDMAKKYDLRRLLSTYCRLFNRNLALQGEIVGPGINGNRGNYDERHYLIFDVFDIDTQLYLLPDDRREILKQVNKFVDTESMCPDSTKRILLEHVAELHEVQEYTPDEYVLDMSGADLEEGLDPIDYARAKILAMADGAGINGTPREGLVFKSKRDVRSFKAISNSYLLKNDL